MMMMKMVRDGDSYSDVDDDDANSGSAIEKEILIQSNTMEVIPQHAELILYMDLILCI